MHNSHKTMNIIHEKLVDLVGKVGMRRLAVENGRLWLKDVSSEGPESIENSLGTAYIFKNEG